MRQSAPIVRTVSILLALGGVLAAPTAARAQTVTTPEQHLGRPLGGDFTLADWQEVSSYYLLLGEQSPNVITQNVGTTTEGRDFLISIISNPENLENLDQIKAHAKTLADPRGRSEAQKRNAIENGRVILFISCQMHSTEAAGSQFGMQFAYDLATSNAEPFASARERCVIVIYNTNPDGIDHVTEWYRRNVGTPFEASGLLKLYQYYSGHDNNRDWFMLTQNETRIITRLLYSEWFPTVYWDVHQQGSNGERIFVPPFRDPLNPNLDPVIMTGIDAIGSRALMDMTAEGLTGVSTGVSYDMWWNGGNRNVPVRHNIMGFLTEAASANLASPIFLDKSDLRGPRGLEGDIPSNQFPAPWPGGWWHLRDIIDYELAFGRSMLGSLGREPQRWLGNALLAAERTIAKGRDNGPRAWIIPSDNRDPDAVRRMLDLLLLSGVEVHVTDAPIDADGRTYPAGSIVIRRDQPYGSHVKDLMEVQRYPGDSTPYDNAGWTLPFLLGVRRVEVMQAVQGDLRQVTAVEQATSAFRGDGRLAGAPGALSANHSGSWSELCKRLSAGQATTFVTDSERAGLFVPSGAAQGLKGVALKRMPRIGLYAPWSGSMNEGWTRYVLDTYEIPYLSVRNEMLRAGNLLDMIDVLLIPSVSPGQLDAGRAPGSIDEEYARGLDPEGAVAIEEFVRRGGTLITNGSSCDWAIDLFQLPLVDVTREEANREFSCPGSVLRGVPAKDDLTVGLPDSVALFFSRAGAFRDMTEAERKEAGREETWHKTLLAYAPQRALLSGWIRRPEVIEGRAAWVKAMHGAGRIHLFAFEPQYRGWAHGTMPLIFRAAIIDGQRE